MGLSRGGARRRQRPPWFGVTPDGFPAVNPIGNLIGAVIMFGVLGFLPFYVLARILKTAGFLRLPHRVELAGLDEHTMAPVSVPRRTSTRTSSRSNGAKPTDRHDPPRKEDLNDADRDRNPGPTPLRSAPSTRSSGPRLR